MAWHMAREEKQYWIDTHRGRLKRAVGNFVAFLMKMGSSFLLYSSLILCRCRSVCCRNCVPASSANSCDNTAASACVSARKTADDAKLIECYSDGVGD
jgi:hypothetical protein